MVCAISGMSDRTKSPSLSRSRNNGNISSPMQLSTTKTRSINSQPSKITTGHSLLPDYEEIDSLTDDESDDLNNELGQTLLTPVEQKTLPTLSYHLTKWLGKGQGKKKKLKTQLSARNLVGEFNRAAKQRSKSPTKSVKKEDNSAAQCKRRIKEFKREADYHLQKYQLLLNNLQLETRKLSNMRSKSASRPASVPPPPPPPRNQPKPKSQWIQRSTHHKPQPLVQNSFRTGYFHPNVINSQHRMMQPNPQHWQSQPCLTQYPLQPKVNNWSAQHYHQRRSNTPRPSLPQKPANQNNHFQAQRNCIPQGWNNTKIPAKIAQVDARTNENLSGLMHLAASSQNQNRPTPKPRYNVAQNRAPLSLSAALNFINSNLQKKTCCQRSESFAFNKF